jgi:hypothetical protein
MNGLDSSRQPYRDRTCLERVVDGNDVQPTATAIFNTSNYGLNTARNTSEVLQIVYAAGTSVNVTSGGFFPNGVNGNIKTTSNSLSPGAVNVTCARPPVTAPGLPPIAEAGSLVPVVRVR